VGTGRTAAQVSFGEAGARHAKRSKEERARLAPPVRGAVGTPLERVQRSVDKSVHAA
jgi:hypothetical protein